MRAPISEDHTTTREAPILVVGGRTTGLAMASELARHGVPVRIIDKSAGIDPHSRATLLHARTLEILHDLELVDEVLAEGVRERGVRAYANGRQFLHSRLEGVDSPYPWGVALPQCRTEEILEAHLERLGVEVERETELVALQQQPDRVQATLRHVDGREESIETPWLIGCDGAHSTVRHQNREAFPGEADPHQFVLADVVVEGPVVEDEGYLFLTDRGVLYMFLLPEGRKLIAADLPEHHDAATETPTLEQIRQLVAERSPLDVRLTDPRWLTYFRIHYRLTPHYRHGRIFLAGDASHIHSLVSGQGMNTGIQDAYNLAWKLALVARGRAGEALLDTYEIERRCIAEDVIATTRAVTESAEIFSHLSPEEREKLCARMVLPERERRRVARHKEEIDLDYRQSPICVEGAGRFASGPHPGAEAPDAGPLELDGERATLFDLLRGPQHTLLLFAGPDSEPVELAAAAAREHGDLMKVYLVASGGEAPAAPRAGVVLDPRGELRRRFGVEAECLYLIRPDGYVATRSESPTREGLRAYLDRVF